MDNTHVIEQIRSRFSHAVIESALFRGDLTLTVEQGIFLELMWYLKDDLGYDLLKDVVGVDYLPRKPRFDVNYVLFSMKDYHQLIVKVKLSEDENIPTVSGIWKAANWLEREAYDLVGIQFAGHPDLRRILTWDDFDGHPLRKDFPVKGKDFDKKFDPDTIKVV